MDSFGQEKKTAAPVPSEIAQNLKVADENAAFKYDESARNNGVWEDQEMCEHLAV